MNPAPPLQKAGESLWLDSFAELRHPKTPTARCSLTSGRRAGHGRNHFAPDTIDTMPEQTLLAYADHGDPVEFMQHNYAAAQGRIAVKTDDLIT